MKKSNSYTIYRDMRGVYRWRLFAPNGRAIADSGEGYKRKRDCLRGLYITANCSVVDWTRVHALGLQKVNIHLTHELRTPLADVLDTTLTKKDLLPGGKLSDWLRDFDRALNDSQSPQPKHTI